MNQVMSRQSPKPSADNATKTEKTLKKLFDERDRTNPGSREEEEAARKILETVFPDTNAD
jgi:hypothetical protein